jgi:polyhydroxybutyrate depolymerase
LRKFLLSCPTTILCVAGLSGCGGNTTVPPAGTQALAPADTAAGATLPSAAPSGETALSPGDWIRTVTIDGLERSYILHAPPEFDAARPIPLVMVFHGLTQDGFYMMDLSGFGRMADTGGFIAVFPNGYDPGGRFSWNAGGGCCNYAGAENIDDIAFVRRILADLQAAATIDPRRIFATGFDDGAMFSYRLGCEMSDAFAAIAPVASVLSFYPCRPAHPVSLFHIHGAGDQFIPLEGRATNPYGDEPFPPLSRGIETWVKADGCPTPARVEQDDGMTHTIYAPCQDDTAVELLVLSVGHRWPPDFVWDAAPNIWEFFAGHPKI